MNLSRMELADVGEPTAIAAAIIKQVPDIPIPVPINEIARQLDISEIRVTPTKGFEGALIALADKSDGQIIVNANGSPQRRRFTIGHELLHFLSPWHKPPPDGFRCTARDMTLASHKATDRAAQMEVEANRFAAEILFPRPHFSKQLRQRKTVGLEHILELAGIYDMSKEATARRYVALVDEPCAGVVSQNGKVLYSFRGPGFPYIEVASGEPVPKLSRTARLSLPEGEVSDLDEVDAAHWLPSDRGKRLPALFEQVHFQQNGFRLTLLNVDREAASTGGSGWSSDDDEDRPGGLKPRFR